MEIQKQFGKLLGLVPMLRGSQRLLDYSLEAVAGRKYRFGARSWRRISRTLFSGSAATTSAWGGRGQCRFPDTFPLSPQVVDVPAIQFWHLSCSKEPSLAALCTRYTLPTQNTGRDSTWTSSASSTSISLSSPLCFHDPLPDHLCYRNLFN